MRSARATPGARPLFAASPEAAVYAARSLRGCSPETLMFYLPQLVQALRFDAAGDVLQFTWCALLCFFQLLWLVVCATAAVTGGGDARMAAEMGAVGVCG